MAAEVAMPKLYRPIKIEFWSLRNAIGENMGVIFDCDQIVERTVMRIRTKTGWQWQIHHINRLRKYDHLVDIDQERLLNYQDSLMNWETFDGS